MNFRKIFCCLLILAAICMTTAPLLSAAAPDVVGDDTLSRMEQLIRQQMKEGKIPGASVVMINKGEVYSRSFGYSDAGNHEPVNEDTLFELGSTSKAFTALAILQLEREGKLMLDDPVSQYIPWFSMKYKGEPVAITIKHLLYQTSGIPFESIGDIPEGNEADTLEKTVRTLPGKSTDFIPGDKFSYATINYDVLGLIIEKISGNSYEEYVNAHVLDPLGLSNTRLFQEEAGSGMSLGYKIGFARALKYDAPVYRGNKPAGYIITNARDMEKWLRIQMGLEPGNGLPHELIERSHIPDRTVMPESDGSSYAMGWQVFQKGSGQISHGGSNPNFSSFIVFRPQEQIGFAVLANMNSAYTESIGLGLMEIVTGQENEKSVIDTYLNLDKVAFTVICVAIPFLLAIIYLLGKFVVEMFRRNRRREGQAGGEALRLLSTIGIIFAIGFSIYMLPQVLYDGLPWSFVSVWAPVTFIPAVLLVFITTSLFTVYFFLTSIFPRKDEKSLFLIATLSAVSGLGNALIIFVINTTVNRTGGFQGGLFYYFLVGIAIYIFGQRIVRYRLIRITNEMVYSKRMELINRVLAASHQKMEEVKGGMIHAGLNNDTEVISRLVNFIVTGLTSCITLLCCLVYLGNISFLGLLISICIILAVAGIYFYAGKSANKLWEQTRDIQNVFFKFINDLIGGFKELRINSSKRSEFQKDMQESCTTYKDKRIRGDLKFANAFIIGEMLFTFAIGAVAFLFPVFLTDVSSNSLRSFVFVFLYIAGPVNGLLNVIPNILEVRISWKRINDLIELLDEEENLTEITGVERQEQQVSLEVREACYKYNNADIDFSIGPVSCDFHSGQISFITGGNGSGKSTLAKLLMGLYKPDSGTIRFNGQGVTADLLGEKFSAVFSDFYLFEKLYGIPYSEMSEEITKYLKTLRLDGKVVIKEGSFNTLKLSTGQRKRLALLISYLEDKPILLFDEWAADQDPEFRQFFYETLLPDLKRRGKCVIAITHDDRYFDLADQVIKMELGKVV